MERKRKLNDKESSGWEWEEDEWEASIPSIGSNRPVVQYTAVKWQTR